MKIEVEINRMEVPAIHCVDAQRKVRKWQRILVAVLTTTAVLLSCAEWARPTQVKANESRADSVGTTLVGIVRDSNRQPVAGATVCLLDKDVLVLSAKTDSAGSYLFSSIRTGVYTVRVEMVGYSSATFGPFALEQNQSRAIDLTLEAARSSQPQSESQGGPEFFDEPHFTVAGVTDTTSLGGHGSSVTVKSQEAVAKATASLGKQATTGVSSGSYAAQEKTLREAVKSEPESFSANCELGKLLVQEGKAEEGLPYLERASRLNSTDYNAAYELALGYFSVGDYRRARDSEVALLKSEQRTGDARADVHHLLADIDEKMGNPLEAVGEYQRAAELNPSEENLFDWGTELLLHRAAQPALEVFGKGTRLFPRSVRMMAALGASWYAVGSYDEAAHYLCEASDLDPNDPNPYLLMGKMQAVEAGQSDAVASRLERFVRLEPENALANYYYAVSIWKRRKSAVNFEEAQVKSLLENAIRLDPKLGEAYLQLGILYSERKEFSLAVTAYRHAIEVTPLLEAAHYRLAQTYLQTRESSKAQAELQLYETISKENTEESERQRHEVQQFVYQLQDRTPISHP